MNEINLKKGQIVLVKDYIEDDWIALYFHHFYDGKILTVSRSAESILTLWNFWKLPDPPKPEKKERFYSISQDFRISGWFVEKGLAIQNDSKWILKLTQEEGKLPVVEVIAP